MMCAVHDRSDRYVTIACHPISKDRNIATSTDFSIIQILVIRDQTQITRHQSVQGTKNHIYLTGNRSSRQFRGLINPWDKHKDSKYEDLQASWNYTKEQRQVPVLYGNRRSSIKVCFQGNRWSMIDARKWNKGFTWVWERLEYTPWEHSEYNCIAWWNHRETERNHINFL